MKHSFKLMFASLALAAAIASAPMLSEPSYAAQHKKAHASDIVLKDGTKLKKDGDKLFVVSSDSTKNPAVDGKYTTKDGKTLTVKDGKLVK